MEEILCSKYYWKVFYLLAHMKWLLILGLAAKTKHTHTKNAKQQQKQPHKNNIIWYSIWCYNCPFNAQSSSGSDSKSIWPAFIGSMFFFFLDFKIRYFNHKFHDSFSHLIGHCSVHKCSIKHHFTTAVVYQNFMWVVYICYCKNRGEYMNMPMGLYLPSLLMTRTGHFQNQMRP